MGRPVILCVDDEVGILKSLERCLTLGGYDVLKAESGAQGLSILEARAGKVDLLLIDQKMPGMTGDELISLVQGRFGQIPAIILGHVNFMTEDREGDHRFVPKPWDNSELLETVGSVLEHFRKEAV